MQARVLFGYNGATKDELSIVKGDIVDIISDENQDWWYVKNSQSQIQGYVPRTYLELVSDPSESPKKKPILKKMSSIGSNPASPMTATTATNNYEANDDNYHSNDDSASYSGSESESDEKSTASTESVASDHESDESEQTRRTSNRTRHKKSNHHKPTHLQIPTYIPIQTTGPTHSPLTPKISASGISFFDLFTHTTDPIRPIPTHTLAFSTTSASGIPNPTNTPFEIIGHSLNLSIQSPTQLSNQISIPMYETTHPQTYKFSKKTSLIFPKDEENTFFIKTSEIGLDVLLLFEFVVLLKTDSEVLRESTVGWGVFPLFTVDGSRIESKSYDIQVHCNDEINIKQKSTGNLKNVSKFWRKLQMQNDKVSGKVNIRVWKIGKKVKEKIYKCLDFFVGFLNHVEILAMYREVLGMYVFQGCEKGESGLFVGGVGDVRASPGIKLFLRVFEEPDLGNLLAAIWRLKLKGMKKQDKKSPELLRKAFTDCVLSMWPLIKSHDMMKYEPGNEEAMESRKMVVEKIQSVGVVESLAGKAGLMYEAFSAEEFCFDTLADC